MEPIYLDLHIHTSDDPNSLNTDYDVDLLLSKIHEVSEGSQHLISLTDHNTINKNAYVNLIEKANNVILGTELHIRNYPDRPPYHCHILFNVHKITDKVIDSINSILDELYPNKVVTKTTETIPTIETIIREFDQYDFVLLPHGGQSHSTFDKSVPRDVKFDSTIERSIYYNQFDGFTARDNRGLEVTIEYFKKLGIEGFVNLVTCSDNYNPAKYPNAKSDDAGPFIPSWMNALPTFDGLRLSLSESSRLIYSENKPEQWSEFINSVYLQNEFADINVTLTPGLNVVIGGSSSGKTMLVDSIYRKLSGDFEGSVYSELGVDQISIQNPSGIEPHYISQNYIMKVIDQSNESSGIEKIEIIKKVFPEDNDVTKRVRAALQSLNNEICTLIDSVKIIEDETNNLSRIPFPTRLVVEKSVASNALNSMLPDTDVIRKITYDKEFYDLHTESLIEISDFISENPFIDSIEQEVNTILDKLNTAYQVSEFERKIRESLTKEKKEIDADLASKNQDSHLKNENIEKLIESTRKYVAATVVFESTLSKIASYSMEETSSRLESLGHELYITNKFQISKEKFVDVLNKYLKTDYKIKSFDTISPSCLFEKNHSKRNPKVKGYEDFQSKIFKEFENLNKRDYKIVTKEGRPFENLSAGWKTSVLLDLILGYKGDLAPLIIDQPEDNLATNYINKGLIESIKKIKHMKQVILVSHNATIPMLGDAQNIILCQNDEKIFVRASQLEGCLDGKSTLDHIAKITDGGKPSIKKRVKKYNLKKFKGESE